MKFIPLFLFLWSLSARADIESDFLAARDAFRSGKTAQLAAVAPRLKNTVLEPYVSYYQLRMRWDEKDSAPIKAYLSRAKDTPVIDQFRGEWLKQLAKTGRWGEFAAEYRKLSQGDDELTCYALQYQRFNDEPGALAATREVWLRAMQQPESCLGLFEAAIRAGVITPADLWQRLRLGLEKGQPSLVKKWNAFLPERERLPPAELEAAGRNPQRYLQKNTLALASAGRRRVALYALDRLARQSVEVAYAQFKPRMAYFPDEEQRYFYARLGLFAALEQDGRALKWFLAAGDEALDERQSAWRARAALRAGDWHEVWSAITAMEVSQQNEAAWRYWKARALMALGHDAEAQTLLEPLSRELHYYGQLAAEELGAAPASALVAVSYQPTETELAAMQARPEIQRTVLLYRLEMRVEAAREWDWALRGMSDRELLVAAEVARRNGMYDRSIDAANRTVEFHDFTLRYPAPYRAALQNPVQEHELEEAWVYGLMRQESRFATHAKSDVGAAGLMQLMPETARWAARRIGMKGYTRGMIHDLDVNLKLGTYYMKSVFRQFDDNPVLATAAYNAGPSRARKWRGERPLEGAIYIETIPFDETRDYVKKVMSNTIYYAKLFGRPTESLKQRLGVIAAKDGRNQQADPDEI